MPQKALQVEILRPDKRIYCASSYAAQIPLYEGLIGVLPGHSPLLALLGCGLMRLEDEEGSKSFVIEGGFVEIGPEKIEVLAHHAENIRDIDPQKAKQDYEQARKLEAKGEEAIQYRLQRLAAARTRLQYSARL